MTHAHLLVGMTLDGGLKVIQKLSKPLGETGGAFSVQYIAQDPSREKLFLKAIDIEAPILRSRILGTDFAEELKDQMDRYTFELKLLERCKEHYTSNVVKARDTGLIHFDDTYIPVPYFTFDLADGNVKRYLKFHGEVDFVWKLKSLHDIFVGVEQLHNAKIIHQDLKPSNIVQFKNDSKLTDLGRSKCEEIAGPYDKLAFSGDPAYAPIEVYEGFDFLQPKEWTNKNLAIDSYMLGNLIAFYFTGLNMSALMISKLQMLGPIILFGTNEEKRGYVENFYNESIEQVKQAIEYPEYAKEIGQMVKELCNPDPNKRADEKTIASRGSTYALHRYITRLDVLYRKASLSLKKNGTIN